MAARRLLPALAVLALALVAAATQGSAGATVDFERVDLAGRPLTLSAFRGRWVVVNFWATWCGPCVREIPMLNAFHRDRADVSVIGVNFEEIDDETLLGFVEEFDIVYPVVRAGSQPLLPFEPLKGLPSTFVVSPSGEITAARVGEVERAWLEANIPAGESG